MTDAVKAEVVRLCDKAKETLDDLLTAVSVFPEAFDAEDPARTLKRAKKRIEWLSDLTESTAGGLRYMLEVEPRPADGPEAKPAPTPDNPETSETRGADPVFPDGSSAAVVRCEGAGCERLSVPGKRHCSFCFAGMMKALESIEVKSGRIEADYKQTGTMTRDDAGAITGVTLFSPARCEAEGCKEPWTVGLSHKGIKKNYCYDCYVKQNQKSVG